MSKKNTILAVANVFCFLIASCGQGYADIFESFGSGANQFTMTFVPIGNPGNAPDTTGNPNPAGSVGYHYNMGKYEVSRDMINKANATGGLGITMLDMTSYGGNGANRPAAGVSWSEAARYVNWLNTNQGYSVAYKFAKQPGEPGYYANTDIQLWLPSDAGYNAGNLFRNSQARYFLPSVDEWYKAAYYDPAANGGTGGYWDYPTGSNAAPMAVSSGTAAGTAVFNQQLSQGPADIEMAGGLSPYGVMGLGGNIWELEETTFDLMNNNVMSFRALRGGRWTHSSAAIMSATSRLSVHPLDKGQIFGFRVASVPEPSSVGLLMLLFASFSRHRKKAPMV